ncbi:NAD(+) diphosphatase [Acidocella sp.]|uniref:NAD(+) diphosphatase n=1 Tax=Acidocella sp. TaxID=50710 RepID=UPI0026034C68|nr:NAD(+) diphosphatase [Acidocella sp.]
MTSLYESENVPEPVGMALDRAAYLRDDPAWQARAAEDGRSLYVVLHEGRALVEETPAGLRAALLPPFGEAPDLFLGRVEGRPVFAVDFTGRDLPAALEGGDYRGLRSLMTRLPATHTALLLTALGMFNWRATHKFCPLCAGALTPRKAGWMAQCEQCGKEHFPRTDAAVIMLITRGEKALLGQSANFPARQNMYSTLAGFVEPGENLEDAVRREVMEETGVRVGAVTYHASQPWPFPASLMLGFHGEGLSEEIVLEDNEILDARWFSREDVRNREALGFSIPPEESIARRLIEAWLRQG